jgi:hypothetical protein
MGRTGLRWLRIGPVTGFSEHGNEPSGSIRKQDIVQQVEYQLFIEYPAQ